LNTRVPQYIYEACVSRSNQYDESDRISCEMTGFIQLKLEPSLVPFISLSSWAPYDPSNFNIRYDKAIQTGIYWAKWIQYIKQLDQCLLVPSDVVNRIIKPLITDIPLHEVHEIHEIHENTNTNEYEWICVVQRWDTHKKQMVSDQIPFSYQDTDRTIGFHIPFSQNRREKYKFAQVMFVSNKKVLIKTKQFRLLHFKTLHLNVH
jgi:hypothetical protein